KTAMEGTKVFTLGQISGHNTKDDCWFVISGKVYDVTKFLEEHPGGDEVLIESSGRDATQDFEDVGHSAAAQELMESYLVGVLDGYEGDVAHIKKATTSATALKKENVAFKEIPASIIQDDQPSSIMKLLQFLVPL
ncbi:hypothetical protein KI387_012449, partial [Taxus chinensis]